MNNSQDSGHSSQQVRETRPVKQGHNHHHLSNTNQASCRVTKTSSMKEGSEAKGDKKVTLRNDLPKFVKSMKNKNLQKGKMPDFKKIHQINFRKMESLSDVMTRNLDRGIDQGVKIARRMIKLRSSGKTPIKKNGTTLNKYLDKTSGKTSEKNHDDESKITPTAHSDSRVKIEFSRKDFNKDSKSFTTKTLIGSVTKVSSFRRKDIKTIAFNRSPTIRKWISGGRTTEVIGSRTGLGNRKYTSGAISRNTFDLAASLAKPLNYKPHKGRLLPFKERKDTNRSEIISKRQTD